VSSQTSTEIDLFAARNLKAYTPPDQHTKLYGIPLQVKQLANQTQRQVSWLGIALVLLGHLLAVYLLATQSPLDKVKALSTKPMLVSIIAPPAPKPELAPIIEPPKPIIEPKPKLKKVVEKIRPIEKPTERLVEATTEPPKEQEITALQSAPVLESMLTKAPPKAESIIEEKIEPPRFGVAYLNNPAPDYPPMSRRAGEEGRVVMKVLVSAEGLAEDVQIEKTSGSDRLDNAAVNAVKRWRFIPAKKNNQPLSAYVLVPMKFALDS
jgi:periplasmic protein TonB